MIPTPNIDPSKLNDDELEILHGLLTVATDNPDYSPWDDWTDEAHEAMQSLFESVTAERAKRQSWKTSSVHR